MRITFLALALVSVFSISGCRPVQYGFTYVGANNQVYILGWIHDNGKYEQVSLDVLKWIRHKANGRIVVAVEGLGYNDTLKKLSNLKAKYKTFVYLLKNKYWLHGFENWTAYRKHKIFLNYLILARNTLMPKWKKGLLSEKEAVNYLCTLSYHERYYLNLRTKFLLKKLLELKRKNPHEVVIGIMGAGHFHPDGRRVVERFAIKNSLWIGLFLPSDNDNDYWTPGCQHSKQAHFYRKNLSRVLKKLGIKKR